MAKSAKSPVSAKNMPAKKDESSALRSVQAPKQRRSEATLHRLLDAAERLIGERGLSDVSVAAIAEAAKSSVGGFYARFKDKDELLRALHERRLGHLEELLGRVTEPAQWEGVGLRAMLERLIAAHDLEMVGRERLIAAYIESSARNPEAWAEGIAFRKQVQARAAQVLLLRRDAITHPDPERAVEFALTQAFALHDMRALYAHIDASLQLGTEAMRKELVRSLYAYLTA